MIPRALAAVCLVVVAFLGACADDKPSNQPEKKSDNAELYAKLVEAGIGVYKVELDDKGRVRSAIVVGQSRISTALGTEKGKEVARQRAELAAKGAFAKWLNEKVSVHQKSEDETILFLEGNQGKDGDAVKESGKAVEKTTSKIESLATSMMRGFKVVHVEVRAADKSYTLVYRWDARSVAATGKLGVNNRKPANNELKDKKITIDDPR